jgi:hypothetical protein
MQATPVLSSAGWERRDCSTSDPWP